MVRPLCFLSTRPKGLWAFTLNTNYHEWSINYQKYFFSHQQITRDDTDFLSRSALCLTQISRISRKTHRYTRVVGKPSVDIPEASTSAARARFVSIRAHLWENILSIWISYVFLLFPTDLHGFSQITHRSARVYHPEGNKQQAARLGRTKVLFCATDAKSRAESSNA